MTKFEERGVVKQMNSLNKYQADRNFEHSCMLCCACNRRADCDACTIQEAYVQAIARFEKKKNELTYKNY